MEKSVRQQYIDAIMEHKDGSEKYESFLESLTMPELKSLAEKEFGGLEED